MLGTLGIELVEATPERVVVEMEVTAAHHQPYGFLHGGVSVVLAETVMSVGAGLQAGPDRRVFGMEINANHMRPVRSGTVRCTGTPLHVGRTTQVWQAEVHDDRGRCVCVSRCTLAVRDANTQPLQQPAGG